MPDGSTNWFLCGPTPADANVTVTSLGSPSNLKVNEWMANPESGKDDWFELYNPDPQPVALGGLYLTDDLNDRTKHKIAALSFLGTGTADGLDRSDGLILLLLAVPFTLSVVYYAAFGPIATRGALPPRDSPRNRCPSVRRRRPEVAVPGLIVEKDGTVLGEHDGIEGFTVGQRKGLHVALGERKFVVRIEQDTRRVVVGDRRALYRRALTARDCNWFDDACVDAQGRVSRCYAQIRYNAPAQPANMSLLPDGRLRVEFDEPQFAVTPGQAVVCYDAENNQRVLGGGWIE